MVQVLTLYPVKLLLFLWMLLPLVEIIKAIRVKQLVPHQ